MGEINAKTIEELRAQIESEYRAQIDDEIRKRKEIEEKYYAIYDELEETTAKYELARRIQMEMAQSNREFLSCKMSFLAYLNRRRIYAKTEQSILDKDPSFWDPVFDAEYYAEHNKDVAAEVGTDPAALLKHFINMGTFQGRQACKDFYVEKYLELNEDVAEICKTDKRAAYIHYIDYGISEKRLK